MLHSIKANSGCSAFEFIIFCSSHMSSAVMIKMNNFVIISCQCCCRRNFFILLFFEFEFLLEAVFFIARINAAVN